MNAWLRLRSALGGIGVALLGACSATGDVPSAPTTMQVRNAPLSQRVSWVVTDRLEQRGTGTSEVGAVRSEMEIKMSLALRFDLDGDGRQLSIHLRELEVEAMGPLAEELDEFARSVEGQRCTMQLAGESVEIVESTLCGPGRRSPLRVAR